MREGRVRLLHGATIFLSAFLLFQVQPILGKTILPWFGSSPGVWTTCMLFFQSLLLGGYAYAHFVVSRLGPKRQAWVHAALLGAALLTLPITPDADWKPTGGEAPTGRILIVLAFSVGLPYLLLCSTGPLIQGWFARLFPERSPYRLYALSNFASLLALVSYPLWVERVLPLSAQTYVWSLAWAVFAVLCVACAWRFARTATVTPPPVPPECDTGRRSGATDVLLWFLLAACGSALLLATTNQMCLDVASVPFLWILPLAIYLLSFILTFDHARWYVRPLVCAVLPIALVLVFRVIEGGVDTGLKEQIVIYSGALFVCCMGCHGELARLKPAPRRLTLFFLVVALGGAAGGLTVALVAPAWLRGFHEFPLLLGSTYALVFFAAGRGVAREGAPRSGGAWMRGSWFGLWLACLGGIGYGTIQAFEPTRWLDADSTATTRHALEDWLGTMRIWALAAPMLLLVACEGVRRRRGRSAGAWWGRPRHQLLTGAAIVVGLGFVALAAAIGWEVRDRSAHFVARGRNFYGVLAIKAYGLGTDRHDWTLKHGRIMHGFQYQRHRAWPTSYYGPGTGVGLAVRLHPDRGRAGRAFRIGIVGLGSGTMAAYGNAHIADAWAADAAYAEVVRRTPPDVVRFYEINPLVRDWAWTYFTYLSDAQARGTDVDVYMGDARLVMERQLAAGAPQRFDVLAIDAFSSDAIPIHLLTKEALETYGAHLAPGGVLAIHVTNRFIHLVPVVQRLAHELHKEIIYVASGRDPEHGVNSCDWLLLTTNSRAEVSIRLAAKQGALSDEPVALLPLWTDDFSNVWDVLKWSGR